MNEPNELKSQAYLTYAEWGPYMSIPRDQRLAECYPQVSAEERAQWLKEFARIDTFIGNSVRESEETGSLIPDFGRLLQQEFPFMNDAAISKANFLASYDLWHG